MKLKTQYGDVFANTKALEKITNEEQTYDDNHSERCIYCDGYLGSLGHKEDCVQKQAAADLFQLRTDLAICQLGLEEGFRQATQLCAELSAAQKRVESARALIAKPINVEKACAWLAEKE